ncbi:MAG: hypothetical protein ACM3VS_11920 [Candidatus Dadabacteria bacterium]
MKSLSFCLNRIVREGYSESFKVTEQGLVAFSSDYIYKPEEVEVVNFFRFEGESDPADNAILYVIETSDGKKGTLIDSYGTYNDQRISSFMEDIAIRKKVMNN